MNSPLGQILRTRRVELRQTLDTIAREVGFSSVFLSQLENGRRTVDLDRVPALADALGLSREYLCRIALSAQFPLAYHAIFTDKTNVSPATSDGVDRQTTEMLRALPPRLQTALGSVISEAYSACVNQSLLSEGPSSCNVAASDADLHAPVRDEALERDIDTWASPDEDVPF